VTSRLFLWGKEKMIAADMIGKYVIVRTKNVGMYAGTMHERDGREIVLTNARKLFSWEGAATLNQLATDGVGLPEECRFPTAAGKVLLLKACDVLLCTPKAKKSIEDVPVWEYSETA